MAIDVKEFKHPLENTWTLWFLDASINRNWEDCLTEVGSFSTIEDFWCLFQNIKPVSQLKTGCDFSLFKRGIRPMWEDPANERGGRWVVNVDKKASPDDLDRFWLELVMCMIGENFADVNHMVNGVTVNIRGKGNKIALWTDSHENEEVRIKILGLKMKEVLGFVKNQKIGYHAHADASIINSPPLFIL